MDAVVCSLCKQQRSHGMLQDLDSRVVVCTICRDAGSRQEQRDALVMAAARRTADLKALQLLAQRERRRAVLRWASNLAAIAARLWRARTVAAKARRQQQQQRQQPRTRPTPPARPPPSTALVPVLDAVRAELDLLKGIVSAQERELAEERRAHADAGGLQAENARLRKLLVGTLRANGRSCTVRVPVVQRDPRQDRFVATAVVEFACSPAVAARLRELHMGDGLVLHRLTVPVKYTIDELVQLGLPVQKVDVA